MHSLKSSMALVQKMANFALNSVSTSAKLLLHLQLETGTLKFYTMICESFISCKFYANYKTCTCGLWKWFTSIQLPFFIHCLRFNDLNVKSTIRISFDEALKQGQHEKQLTGPNNFIS